MNEIDILKSIAENLSERKSTAALNNYEVLCNNIQYVNTLLSDSNICVVSIQNEIANLLKKDDAVSNDSQDSTKPLFYFRRIIPRILLNDISVVEKLISQTRPDNREGVTLENVTLLQRSFIDYNNLVTSARQYIDSLIANAYQYIILESKVINFQVLTSLSSFSRYATKSIKQGLFNAEIEKSLAGFNGLSYAEKIRGKESNITKCDNRTFGEKVDFIFKALDLETNIVFKEEIKNLFSFSSEFTHIGYVSTFFSDSKASEIVFSDEISPYLPSSENFSELKYEILESVTRFYAIVYLPSIAVMLKKMLTPTIFASFKGKINDIKDTILDKLKTRNNEYYFFICNGLIKSNRTIDLPCMCREINHWKAPHDINKMYCKNCGSKFVLMEVEGDPGYIITSTGPIKVIGSAVPDFDDLSYNEKLSLLKKCQELIEKKHEIITNIEHLILYNIFYVEKIF